MRNTLSIPDAVAHRFQVTVPPRHRSRLVPRLLEETLARHDDSLVNACRSANCDKALEHEMEVWQAFDDKLKQSATPSQQSLRLANEPATICRRARS